MPVSKLITGKISPAIISDVSKVIIYSFSTTACPVDPLRPVGFPGRAVFYRLVGFPLTH
jgi:hypothetical protein